MSEPCDLSASDARRLIGQRELSPVELLESCIDRTEAVNAAVNAVTDKGYDSARTAAKAAEDAVMRGERLGRLHGLPLGVKDLVDAKGLLTTYGSPIYKDNVARKDHSMVAALRKAGAVVFCKTNVPVFGSGANTTNPVWGPTRNPFDTARICGGSSGGAAVALACNMMPIATGSDSGGSLRIPAAFCGVVAHRSTPGVIPNEGHKHGYTTNGVLGPMARSVEDMVLMWGAMARYEPDLDPMAQELPAGSFDGIEDVDLSSLRIAVSEDLGATDVDAGIRGVFRERVGLFGSAFKSCADAHPDFSNVRDCYWILRSLLYVSSHKNHYDNHRDAIGPNVAMNYEAGLKLTAGEIAWATQEQTDIYRRTQAFFKDYDILICPTVAVPPFPVEQLYCEAINGKKLERYLDWLAMTWIVTTPGNPVTNIPCGLDHTGTPFGLQIIGRQRDDRFVVGVARALERLFQGSAKLKRPVPDIAALAKA